MSIPEEHDSGRRDALRYLIGAAAVTALAPRAASAALAPAPDRTESFLQLSSILTGQPVATLDRTLAPEYIDRLERQAPGVLAKLLATFRALEAQAGGDRKRLIALVREHIWQPGTCRSATYEGAPICQGAATPMCCLARDIPLLWYAGALMEITALEVPPTQFVYGSSRSYLGAIAWKTGAAHPQAQCGGTYGYWSAAPGEAHKTRG